MDSEALAGKRCVWSTFPQYFTSAMFAQLTAVAFPVSTMHIPPFHHFLPPVYHGRSKGQSNVAFSQR
jgi:hypothetical protein